MLADVTAPAIIEGNFYWRSQLEELAGKLGAKVFTLEAPLEVCIERDSLRQKPHGEEAVRVVFRKVHTFSSGKVIDVNKPLAECVDEILDLI